MNTSVGGLLAVLALFVLVWGFIGGIKLFANRFPPAKSGDPAGVGGWLLFLILALVIVGPVFNLGALYGEFSAAENQRPDLTSLPVWYSIKRAYWLAYFVFSGLGLYAGIGLATGREPSVVKRAKTVLWLNGPVYYVVMNIVLPFIFFGGAASAQAPSWTSNRVPELIGGLLGSAIVAGLWTSYLSGSKRVAATYGDDP